VPHAHNRERESTIGATLAMPQLSSTRNGRSNPRPVVGGKEPIHGADCQLERLR
jgi:hypothetical protein